MNDMMPSRVDEPDDQPDDEPDDASCSVTRR
jgi:hypothetical protein